jgi:RNA polymerase primary sigma factor
VATNHRIRPDLRPAAPARPAASAHADEVEVAGGDMPAGGRGADASADRPLLDTDNVLLTEVISRAKERGYLARDALNAVLPVDELSSDQIEDLHAMLHQMGIELIEADEAQTDTDEKAAEEDDRAMTETTFNPVVEVKKSVPGERMYLREMGSVKLLTREGEAAVAQRNEAGREAMVAGLCESPLTFQAIIIWRDELNDGKVLLRDIVDIDATYAGSTAAFMVPGPLAGTADVAAPRAHEVADAATLQPAGPTDRWAAKPPSKVEPGANETGGAGEAADDEADLDADDMENAMSLAAIEAELKPKVLEIFDTVADTYKKLRRLQDQNVESRLKNETLSPAQERKYKTLKS